MTVEFFCPYCNEVFALDSERAGEQMQCTNCEQFFIIPSKNFESPQRVSPPEPPASVKPGFYKAVLFDSWKIFFRKENVTSLTFVTAIICFKFFLSKQICCVGDFSHLIVWGWLMGFYLNIIEQTAMEIDTLPEIELGTYLAFVLNIVKPIVTFLYTLLIALLPFIISLSLLQDEGITRNNMWQPGVGPHTIPQILLVLGLFTFPVTILTNAIGKDFTLLRPDYLITPMIKAPMPYLLVTAILVAAAIMQMRTSQFDIDDPARYTAGKLALNLLVQVTAIIAMRSIGLFYRHYNCHLKW